MKPPQRLMLLALTIVCLAVPACGVNSARTPLPVTLRGKTLSEARRGFVTKLRPESHAPEAMPKPPEEVFRLVRYDAPVGHLGAYLSPDPGDGQKHPAILWITGGDCNSVGEVWEDAPRENDQTASAFRKAGIVMMFPSLRGGNDNPGQRESFFGEVDDVLAAADYLARQTYVDPTRIYLGGHSTGGTLVMLVAESSNRFRGVFSFGPVDDITGYGPEYIHFDATNSWELALRCPGDWLGSVASPLFVFEGDGGNLGPFQTMAQTSTNPAAHFHLLRGFDHFNILGPVNELIAAKILADRGATSNIVFTPAELTPVTQ